MAINPLALSINNPDTVGRAFQGFEHGVEVKGRNALAANGYAAVNGDKNALAAVYADNPRAGMAITQDNRVQGRADDAKRLEGLKGLANMGRNIMRLPPDQRGAALEQAKVTAAQTYGLDPASLAYVTPDTIDDLTATVETEYDRLAQALGVQSTMLGIQGQQLDIQGKRDSNAYWQGQLGGGTATPSAGAPGMAAPSGGGYYDTLIQNESGGNPNARAVTSSATGYGQFIDSTWNSLVNSPEGRAAGLTPDGRSNRDQSIAALKIYNDRTAAMYETAGIPMTQKTAYFAALLGPAGAVKAFQSDPNASAASIFPREAEANKSLFYANGRPRTVAELYDYQTRKFPDAPIDGLGAGGGVGVQPQPQPAGFQRGNGSMLLANDPSGAGQPAPAPMGQPQPSAAPAQPQSVVDLVQRDPQYQALARQRAQAARAGDTSGAAQAGALMEARVKELAATLPPVLAPKDQLKADQEAAKLTRRDAAALETAKSTLETVDRALQKASEPEDFRTGLAGSVAGLVPGTGAYDLDALVQTLNANLSFEALQTMRNNSPTGGALGAVSDADLRLLASQVANLAIGQSKEQLVQNIQLVRDHYKRIVDAAEADASGSAGAGSPQGGDVIEYDENGNRK